MNKTIQVSILNNEYKVIVCFGNPKQISKVLKAWGHIGGDTTGSVNRRGACYHTENCHPLIAMPRFPKTPTEIGTLAHEATHAVHHIFKMIEEKYTDTEIFAHSVGAIVRKVLQK
jgi:hypothetical protein